MRTGLIALIVAVIVIAGGAFFVMKKNNKSSTATTPATNTTNTTQTTTKTDNSTAGTDQPNPNTKAVATITYSDSGFSPSTITVKAGSKVEIKNTSSHDMQFDSDPHPVHTDDTELNVGTVASGQSMTFTVNKTGTHGYHNHLNPSDTGTIIVQ
jgi:plastocyanin